MKTDPDSKIMLRFRKGDNAAFRILFDKYKKKIINFCYRFCNNKELAEELAQEVFLRVYKASSTYRPEANFSTWIFKIATNVCLNELRKKQYLFKTESLDVPIASEKRDVTREIKDDSPLQPQEILESKEKDHLIRKAISSLPAKQRAALLLRIYHDFSYQEIGKQIKSTESGVKTLIHRGRQNLKKALQRFME